MIRNVAPRFTDHSMMAMPKTQARRSGYPSSAPACGSALIRKQHRLTLKLKSSGRRSMLKRIATSIRRFVDENWNVRDLCRFDCRCLEDIGLEPRDLALRSGWSCSGIKHHPSWDAEARGREVSSNRIILIHLNARILSRSTDSCPRRPEPNGRTATGQERGSAILVQGVLKRPESRHKAVFIR